MHADLQRELRDHSEGFKTILIREHFMRSPEELWRALTEPEQVARWYLPLSGELRAGGYYVLEGNALGQIVRCDRPRELELTWVYGELTTNLWLRLWIDGAGTMLELEQSPVPEDNVCNPTPELWGLATAWEMCLAELRAFVNGELPDGPATERRALNELAGLATALEKGAAISAEWEKLLAQ